MERFDIRQPVFFAGLNWSALLEMVSGRKPTARELPKYPAVQRDIAMIVSKQLPYFEVERSVQNIRLGKLQSMKLFDIFESEKLGTDKKSLAVSFLFQDDEKTLTDKEVDGWMTRIMTALETVLQAEIRKQ